LLVRLGALLLVLIFFLTLTGRWLAVFTGPALTLLRESYALAGEPLVRELRDAVVQIYADGTGASGSGRRRGSGFNIEPFGLIVTNRHLVENAALVRVSFSEQGTFLAERWVIYPQADLALVYLDLEDSSLPVARLAGNELPQVGEELLVIGNPLQFTRLANRGELAGLRGQAGLEDPLLVIRAQLYPGSSGSPVFNEQGAVCGVVFAVARGAEPEEAYGLALPVAEVRRFLRAAGHHQDSESLSD